MVDYKPVLVIVVFLTAFMSIQVLFNSELITNNLGNNYTIYYNNTYATNITTLPGGSVLPQPPDCQITWDFTAIFQNLDCVGNNVRYFIDLTTYRTDIFWINVFILIPLIIVLIWQIVLLISDLKKV